MILPIGFFIGLDSLYLVAGNSQYPTFVSTSNSGLTYNNILLPDSFVLEKCTSVMIDKDKPSTNVYIASKRRIIDYNPLNDSSKITYTGLRGEVIATLVLGSILVGTTTGFYTLNLEPWEDLVLSINQKSISSQINIIAFPNPVTDNLLLKANCNTCKGKLGLYSVIGIKIMDIPFVNNTYQTISVQNLKSGTYFIKGQIDNESVSYKVSIIN